jgi:hypothetical protein
MNAYLLVFDDSRLTREQVWRKLNKLPEIGQWYSIFGNTFCLASDQTAQSLAAKLREEVIPEVRFVISEIDAHKKGGWLPREIWDFIDEPKALGNPEDEEERRPRHSYHKHVPKVRPRTM